MDNVYQLKVTIADSRPPIWRRVLVPAHFTLADLHRVIQALMGWHDSHLHEFELPPKGKPGVKTRRDRIDAVRYGPLNDPAGKPMEWLFDSDAPNDEAARLNEVAPGEKGRFLYVYDMGDSWEHDIVVEKILPAAPGASYPLCVTGRRNGPVEDCGGIWGYEELLGVLGDPFHKEHKSRRAWLKRFYGVSDWDADAFDRDGINARLRQGTYGTAIPVP